MNDFVPDASRPTVLVVDDESSVRMFVSETLGSYGYVICCLQKDT